MALGCMSCFDLSRCGGLKRQKAAFNCLDDCCNSPTNCRRVCPNNAAQFVSQMREVVDYWDLSHAPRATALQPASIQSHVPIVYHRGSVGAPRADKQVVLSLYQMYSRLDGRPRFRDRQHLNQTFALNADCEVILSGVAPDSSVESWWSLGSVGRREAMAGLRDLGVVLVTVPNFSYTLGEPRWSALHAMSRTACVFNEFLGAGIQAALHVSGAHDRDYERWTAFVCQRKEVQHISAEFITGPALSDRRDWHVEHLASLAQSIGRDVHLCLRGRSSVVPLLARYFRQLSYIDARPFMATMKRERFVPHNNRHQRVEFVRTEVGASLDALWQNNVEQRRSYIDLSREAE